MSTSGGERIIHPDSADTVTRLSYAERSWQHASTTKCGVINHPRGQGEYTKQNSGENHGQRPEDPGEMSFSYVLYAVVQ
jgi:hypothetical protein